MPIFSGYSFDGPYEIGKKLVDRAAVYLVLAGNDKVIDVGQSGETGTRLVSHERKPCWDRNGGKWFCIRWMPSDRYSREDRERVEHDIRINESPTCGEV